MLRGENGCPWNKEQKLEDWVKYLLDEAAEVKEAIEKIEKLRGYS